MALHRAASTTVPDVSSRPLGTYGLTCLHFTAKGCMYLSYSILSGPADTVCTEALWWENLGYTGPVPPAVGATLWLRHRERYKLSRQQSPVRQDQEPGPAANRGNPSKRSEMGARQWSCDQHLPRGLPDPAAQVTRPRSRDGESVCTTFSNDLADHYNTMDCKASQLKHMFACSGPHARQETHPPCRTFTSWHWRP